MSSVRSFSISPDPEPIPTTTLDTPVLHTFHPKFYIQEGMTTFLIENCLFRIHHHFLVRESEKFRSIIMRPRDPPDDVIPLPDVTCHEFECLLDFFYNGMHEDYGPTFKEWLALLSIATRSGMVKIRQTTISQIESQPLEMDPIEKIMLANLHGIEGWIAPAYADLCRRAEPLQVCEAEKLGLAVTVKLAQAREEFYAGGQYQSGISNPAPKQARATEIVNEIFWPKYVAVTKPIGDSPEVIYGKRGKKK